MLIELGSIGSVKQDITELADTEQELYTEAIQEGLDRNDETTNKTRKQKRQIQEEQTANRRHKPMTNQNKYKRNLLQEQ